MTDYQRLCYLMATDAARLGGLPLWLAFRLLPGVLLGLLLVVLLSSVALAQVAFSQPTLRLSQRPHPTLFAPNA